MTPFSDSLIYQSEPSIQTGKRDNLPVSSPSAVECSYNGSVHRLKHAGLREPVNPDRKYRSDFPRDCRARSRRGPDPVHPRNCRTRVLDFRGHNFDDRRPDALGIQVTQKNKPVGGFGKSTGLPAHILVLAILFSALIIPFASASTIISFSPVGMDPDDIHIFDSTGTLVGIYNTSSTAIPLTDNQSYSILVVPSNANLLGNHPDTWFQNFVTKLNANSIGILVGLACVAFLIAAITRR